MKPLHTLKKYYQSAFRHEITSGLNLLTYKLLSTLLGATYTLKHIRTIYESKKRLNTIKTDIRKKNKSAFVFANGPSLKNIDFSKINKMINSGDYDLIAVNSFLSKSAEDILPTFAVFADNLHFSKSEQSSQYLEDVGICKQHMINYFVPLQYFEKHNKNQIGYNSFCNIFSRNTTNIYLPPGFYGLTALHALRIAKYLGYRHIYICGFDNSYFKDYEVKQNGEMVIRHAHYYDSTGINTEVPCIYSQSSEFFFDTYKHFKYIEKITGDKNIFSNIALNTYISTIRRDTSLDVYKDNV